MVQSRSVKFLGRGRYRFFQPPVAMNASFFSFLQPSALRVRRRAVGLGLGLRRLPRRCSALGSLLQLPTVVTARGRGVVRGCHRSVICVSLRRQRLTATAREKDKKQLQWMICVPGHRHRTKSGIRFGEEK